MSAIFLHIINMSITASYVILAVMFLRLVIKRAPKWISVALWGVVALRLICPFSIESVLSLIPSATPVSPSIMTDEYPDINSGIPIVNDAVNPIIGEFMTPNVGDSVNPLQIWIPILTILWLVGVAVFLIYAIVSYMRIRHSVNTAVLLEDNVYQSENIASPFVLGLFKPRIYLPFDMNEKGMAHVLAHERAHICRKDHIWKPIGFILLSVYWFNPLVWMGYILLCRDIELACDERVIKELDHDARADYSEALLVCSVNRRMIAACPLAFGEVAVKDRVKHALSYKKPAFWIIIVSLVACVAVSVCFLTNPKDKKDDASTPEIGDESQIPDETNPDRKPENRGETDPTKLTDEQIALMKSYPEYFGIDAAYGLDVYVWQMAANSYCFGLAAHGEPIGLLPKAASSDSMRHILGTYNVEPSDISIVPWTVAHSSYIGDFWVYFDGEDAEAKKAAFAKNVWDLLTDQRIYGTESGTPELVYMTPIMSYVDSYYSGIKIVDDVLYDLATGEMIGTLSRKHLNELDLDQKLMEDFEPYEGLGNRIRHNTFLSYEVSLSNTPKGVDLYYVIIKTDGSALLVYGHYDNGVKTEFLRWIFNVGD